jgi:hypothetical protein
MAELKSLGTIFPSLLATNEVDRASLVEVLPALSEWVDDAFPQLTNTAAAAAWRDKYGSLVDRLCEADGSSIKISEQLDTTILAVMLAARSALLVNSNDARNSLHGTVIAGNPFRDNKGAANTFERLLAVASSMYFAVEAKTRK